MNDPEVFNAFMKGIPQRAFILPLVAHLSQSFVGGWIAARLGASRPMVLAMIVGALSLAGGIVAMTLLDGPNWMFIELPLYLVVAWFAGKMERDRRTASGE
jgi:nitrate/nitrite transporter NarK